VSFLVVIQLHLELQEDTVTTSITPHSLTSDKLLYMELSAILKSFVLTGVLRVFELRCLSGWIEKTLHGTVSLWLGTPWQFGVELLLQKNY
jgi:hypothetical protein